MHKSHVTRFLYISIIIYFPDFVLYVEPNKHEQIYLCCDCMRGQIRTKRGSK